MSGQNRDGTTSVRPSTSPPNNTIISNINGSNNIGSNVGNHGPDNDQNNGNSNNQNNGRNNNLISAEDLLNNNNGMMRIPLRQINQFEASQRAHHDNLVEQRNILAQMQKNFELKNSGKPETDGSPAVDISNDVFAQDSATCGYSTFSVEKFATDLIHTDYAPIHMDIINKVMSLDSSIKRGEALDHKKFNPFIWGLPSLLLHGLIHNRMRVDIQCGSSWENCLRSYVTCSKLINSLCLRYVTEVQVNAVYTLGSRIGSKSRYNGNLVQDVQQSFADATFNRQKVKGYDKVLANRDYKKSKKSNGYNNGYNNNNRKKKIDFSIYKDKTNSLFVPPGWCLWKFGVGSCNKGGQCRFKHQKWSDDEYKKAKE